MTPQQIEAGDYDAAGGCRQSSVPMMVGSLARCLSVAAQFQGSRSFGEWRLRGDLDRDAVEYAGDTDEPEIHLRSNRWNELRLR